MANRWSSADRLDNADPARVWLRERLVILRPAQPANRNPASTSQMILFTIIGGPIMYEQIENVGRAIDSVLLSPRRLLTAPELTHRSSYEATRCGIIGIVRKIALGRFDGRDIVALEVV